MQFAYTKPDGWKSLRFTGTAEEVLVHIKGLLQKRSAGIPEPCSIAITTDGRTADERDAVRALEDGKSIRLQLMVGTAMAFGPVSDVQELRAHDAHVLEGQRSLAGICAAIGADYELPR